MSSCEAVTYDIELWLSFFCIQLFFLHRDSAEVVFGKPLFFSSRKDYPSIAKELEGTLRMM